MHKSRIPSFTPDSLYVRILKSIGFDREDTFLAVCAGNADKAAFLMAGAVNVTISNLEPHAGVSDYAPYSWEYQDAERISAIDRSYDWCTVQAGLHHCASPHQALCEMLRVARKGIIVIEARDSLTMRAAIALGLTGNYELEPALLSGGKWGGYRNSKIPNYIYRWTEREVEKTVRSMLPQLQPDIEYFHHFSLPLQRLSMSKSFVKRAVASIGQLALPILQCIVPKQANQFGFVIRVDRPLQPWLLERGEEIEFNMEYLQNEYDPARYRRQ